METKDYVVTDLAGPRVAGKAAAAGDTVTLTEAQADGELRSGAIVPKGKGDKPSPKADEVFKITKKLEDIQARAIGKDKASEPDPPPADAKPATGDAPPVTPAPDRGADKAALADKAPGAPAGGLGATPKAV